VVRHRCRRLIQVQLIIININIIIILHLILNKEDIHLHSLAEILSLIRDGEVTDSPTLGVVQLPFPVEMEYRSLALLPFLALHLSPMADMKHLHLLYTMVDISLLLDHLHTVRVDTMHILVDIKHLLDLLQGSLTRAGTEEVPVVPVLNSLILRHGPDTTLSAPTVITLPIKVVGGEAMA